MAKRMLIDAAHPEETRVVVLNGHRLDEFDFETSTKKQIKGNIYLAKVTRVEPSLQAAFVEYGGNRHGFLAFGEIHPDYYRIPVADRRAALEDDRAAQAAEDALEERHAGDGGGTRLSTEPAGDFAERLAEEASLDVIRGPESDATALAEEEEEAHGDHNDNDERFAELDENPHAAGDEPDGLKEAPVAEFEPPASDAFAEDDEAAHHAAPGAEGLAEPETQPFAESDAANSQTQDRDHGEPPLPSPSDDAEIHPESAAPRVAIETLGGDEIEETTQRRARPHRHYKIQEVIKRRQIMLVQVTKEERGNKGAALTTYISLAGRYCVLMPNTPRGGGVSRKITSMTDRRRLKDLMSDLEVPEGMGVIVRTAGSERSKGEIKRDFEYLLRLWDDIRELTLKSTAPALIYEEGNLIKRSIRDLYTRDIDEVLVDGRDGYETAKAFMKMLMPSHTKRVRFYNDPSVPLFHRFQVEGQLDAIHSPIVQLRSGGYIVINPTEALVAIDVNSGRSTRERNIEETALKTNTEAAEEIARQLRLRDLAGLIVIDFIDMEEYRNNNAVERRLKDAMRHDRARIQVGRISPFGLLELSRQRLRPSLLEASTQPCPHCGGTGHIRSTESTALHVLRAIEEEGMRRRSAEISVAVPSSVALYILNQKRAALQQTEARYGFHVTIAEDDALIPPAFRLERVRALTPAEVAALPVLQPLPMPQDEPEPEAEPEEETLEEEGGESEAAPARSLHPGEEGMGWIPQEEEAPAEADWEEPGEGAGANERESHGHRRRRRRRRRGGRERERDAAFGGPQEPAPTEPAEPEAFGPGPVDQIAGEIDAAGADETHAPSGGEAEDRKRRRRGRRGGRRRRRGQGENSHAESASENDAAPLMAAAEDEETSEHGEVASEVALSEFIAEAYEPPVAEPASPPEAAPPPAAPATAPDAESAAQPESEPERAPAAYNVSPAHEVSGPPANPRRGWWRRR
ncbi:MAG TPA: Rne/Rng family ribonuclease [Stellaceae bacterium]|nr:Rne/Rng family ribonuclease [Stellaceae bacterium]